MGPHPPWQSPVPISLPPQLRLVPPALSSPLMAEHLDPGPILQGAFGFWSSKVLLTAVEFGLFTELGDKKMTGAQIERALRLHPRATYDFLDALVAMKFLDREGNGAEALYSNTPTGQMYLNAGSPRYVGGILEMLNA